MSDTYLLGTNDKEIERMHFQHEVWKGPTDGFFDRIGIEKGWRCLDAGAGPGFTTADLRERVGAAGSVTALEPSQLYVDYLSGLIVQNGWSNVDVVASSVDAASLPREAYDLVFARWVLNFIEDRRSFLASLARVVKKNGLIAVMDYWYEGLSVYPRGTPFDRIPDLARAYYASGGGNAYGIGEMAGLLRDEGFEVVDTTPMQLAGDKDSGVFRWAYQFFTEHIPLMAEKGLLSAEERDEQLNNFSNLSQDPETRLFSPIILSCVMRKHA
jgi:ubiquinone/menaquinone biosynthesis C-methylase UbiE